MISSIQKGETFEITVIIQYSYIITFAQPSRAFLLPSLKSCLLFHFLRKTAHTVFSVCRVKSVKKQQETDFKGLECS